MRKPHLKPRESRKKQRKKTADSHEAKPFPLSSLSSATTSTTIVMQDGELGVDGDQQPTTSAVLSHEISAVESSAAEEFIPLVESTPPLPADESTSNDKAASCSLDDLRARIMKQVEFYFSDENLPNDKFLMRHMKKDKEGFVSISLIASFRKMKRLTKDSSLIVDVLKESSHLVVSSDGKMVKRLHPLPLKETKKTKDSVTKSCTVIVENLPLDHSEENIQRIFGQVGSIKSICIHDPLADEAAMQKKAKKEKPISSKVHAVIEYEAVEAAEKAVATLNDETNWRNGLRVQLVGKRMGYGLGRKVWRDSDPEKGGHNRAQNSVKDDIKCHSNEQRDNGPDDEDGDHASKERNASKGRNRSKARKYRSNNGMGHGSAGVVEPSKPPPGPRMPDGTRGFTMGRGRPPISYTV